MRRISAFITPWLVIANVLVAADDRASHARILAEAETRLKAIYDQREFAPDLTAITAGIPRLSLESEFSPSGDRLLFRRGPDLYVFDLVGQRTTSLSRTDAQSERDNGVQSNWRPDPGTFYISDIRWAGNSEELLIEILSRSRDSRTFLLANTKTGTTTKAYEESDPAWVDTSYSANAGLEWIQDGRTFVLLSERDGWRHAYVVSRDGKQQTLLTRQPSDIIARGPVDERGGWFYFLSSPENATQRYPFRVRLDGTADAERVTPKDQPGTHRYDFSPDRKWAFHTRSTFDSPPVIDLVELSEHRSVRVLEDNAECRRRVSPLISQPTEFLKLDIGGGVVMDAWMIKPRDFDSKQKYPVFVFVYGEPHAQTVLDGWSGGGSNTLNAMFRKPEKNDSRTTFWRTWLPTEHLLENKRDELRHLPGLCPGTDDSLHGGSHAELSGLGE